MCESGEGGRDLHIEMASKIILHSERVDDRAWSVHGNLLRITVPNKNVRYINYKQTYTHSVILT